MTLRRLTFSFVPVFAALCSLSFPVLAQPRASSRQLMLQGALPARGSHRTSMLPRRNPAIFTAPETMSARDAVKAREAMSAPVWNISARFTPRPTRRLVPGFDPWCPEDANPAAPTTIALGAYFYQNGQCAPGDESAVSAWRARTGRLPAVWMIFQGWTGWNQFPIAQARRAQQLGGRLMVTWEPWSGTSRAEANWNCARIAAGAQDAYIRQYARAVKEATVPIMIRFAHEMNGDWYPWGVAFNSNFRRNNGNTPAHYVAMWRRVVALFREEGALNAQWVWAPNIQFLNRFNSERDQSEDLRALYPGDDAVNWIGLSVYNDASKRSWRTFSDLFDSTYRTLTRLSPRPMMIAELGVTEAGAPYGTSKAAWISQALMRDIPTHFPRVKLVNWFCRDKTSLGEANYRFDSSPGALQAFRIAVNSPLYGGRISEN